MKIRQVIISVALLLSIFAFTTVEAEVTVRDYMVVSNIGPGTIDSPAIDLPAGLILSDVELVCPSWPDEELLWSVNVERSDDSGATWQNWFGAAGTGEQGYDKQGNPVMPRFGVYLDGSQGPIQIRIKAGLNKRIRIGLKGLTE